MRPKRIEPIRKDEFTKDQWFDICRQESVELTRDEFEKHWPAFCKYLEEMQNNMDVVMIDPRSMQ